MVDRYRNQYDVLFAGLGRDQCTGPPNLALQAMAANGKPPIQVTVDFGQATGAMLTDALKDKPEKGGNDEKPTFVRRLSSF